MKKEYEITALVQKHYKSVRVCYCKADTRYGEDVFMGVIGRKSLYPYIAARILREFNDLKWVHFIGDFINYVYSLETLKWGGYVK